ncbi:hypothetical protein [Streptomyces europaeiscabiei]|uniref:hypothetical protein n=1 Tax=Streptomyces europaeiscabiei TaxID=146819 RepID=UPI0029A1239D|nr:hypothetical protein [Streptomyces europaeiscabiei]MDX3672698.1 hypothetical protein [Streptomyces europaeiscabiei]
MTAKTRRPYAVECGPGHDALTKLPHGAPLLTGGLLQAGHRDASFLRRPDVRTDKASHIIVVSHEYAVGRGVTTSAAACDPKRIMIDEGLVRDAVAVHPNGRCRRPGCRQLFARASAEANSIEHIRNYYGLAVHGGMRVKHSGRPGVIVGYSGQYIEVLIDGADRPTTCHATSEMEYPPGTRVGPDPDERFAHLVQVHPA